MLPEAIFIVDLVYYYIFSANYFLDNIAVSIRLFCYFIYFSLNFSHSRRLCSGV